MKLKSGKHQIIRQTSPCVQTSEQKPLVSLKPVADSPKIPNRSAVRQPPVSDESYESSLTPNRRKMIRLQSYGEAPPLSPLFLEPSKISALKKDFKSPFRTVRKTESSDGSNKDEKC